MYINLENSTSNMAPISSLTTLMNGHTLMHFLTTFCMVYSFSSKNRTSQLFDEWLFYYCNVIDYFQSVNESERLIVFDTEKDHIDVLKKQFYKTNDIHLNGELPKTNHHNDHPQGTG
eukprot:457787_1